MEAAWKFAPDRKTRDYVNGVVSEGYAERAEYYGDKEIFELSILNYTEALTLDPNNDTYYRKRAYAHLRNCEFDEAISDYDHAIENGDKSAEVYIDRGMAREAKLDLTGAILDYSHAVKLDEKNDVGFGLRGRAFAIIGNLSAARRDLEHTNVLNPNDTSTVLWLHLVHMRLREKDDAWLRKRATVLALNRWPGPVISYFLGSKQARDIVNIALNDPKTATFHQRCDAWFYLGEDALAHNDVPRATRLFRKTVNGCNAVDYEWVAAKAELNRIARMRS